MRLVTGPKNATSACRRSSTRILDPKAFSYIAKTLEMRQRHNKFENTPAAPEPNCKESPGGLRDLQVGAVARAAGLGQVLGRSGQNGSVTLRSRRGRSRPTEALLSLIRARLHIISGRREDRLVFDLQTAVAESFGYSAGGRRWQPAAAPGQRSADAP